MDTANTATKITASMIDEIIASGYGAMVLMFNRIRGPQPSVIRERSKGSMLPCSLASSAIPARSPCLGCLFGSCVQITPFPSTPKWSFET